MRFQGWITCAAAAAVVALAASCAFGQRAPASANAWFNEPDKETTANADAPPRPLPPTAETSLEQTPAPAADDRQFPVPPPDDWSTEKSAGVEKPNAAVTSSRRQAEPQGAPPAANAAPQAGGGFDPALVARGSAAFQNACTQCHDAERSTSKVKDLAGWRATVRRMAGKSGADVPQGDWEAIATYLASLSARTGGGAGGSAASATTDEQQLSLWAVFSPTWREGNDNMELPGFFPQTWVGANWQGKGALSGRVTACVTCHIEAGNAHRIELVEAALRVDLVNLVCHRDSPVKAIVDAGRFIVPFGAFSSQVNPGAYRTVATPLIYTMGQRVFPGDIGDPVLPMPYADQGANFNMSVPVIGKTTATLDAYVVNGLRGTSTGIDFYDSRNYVSGNKEPALGTRATLGNQFVRLGGSLTSGRFNDDTGSGPRSQGLYYRIYGVDLTARYENLLRFQIEYANRDTDRVVSLPGQLLAREHVGGMYMEGEVRFHRKSKWSYLVRYDLLDHRSVVPPPGSTLPTGNFDVKRTTAGVNYQLTGNSLLMLNYERWILPGPLPDLNVYGVRWAATF
ncbi:MAG TPA: hypothetical protein VG125_22885 [Pirellulales bacterium]|nr:hypothetical protein [Pirellulales bacterium]